MAERDFAEIARLSERYSKDPKSRIFVQLADAYRKNGMMDEALDILNKGLQYHPDYALGFLILGKCYYDQRKYEQAKDAFETTIKHDPQNIVALRMIAQICENLKDESGQIAAYKGILNLDPFDASAKEKLGHLETLQKKEPLYTIAIAQEYEKQGDLKKALEVYEHLSFTDPSDLLLKEKVNSLRSKLTSETKQVEQQKIAELQVETFFRPEQIDISPPEISEPSSGATDTIQASELLEPAASTPSEEEPSDIVELEEISETEGDQKLDIMQPIEAQAMEEPTQTIDIVKPVEEMAPDVQAGAESQPEEIIESGDLLEPVIEPEQSKPVEPGAVQPGPTETKESVDELSMLEPVKEVDESGIIELTEQPVTVTDVTPATAEPPAEVKQKPPVSIPEPPPEVKSEPPPVESKPVSEAPAAPEEKPAVADEKKETTAPPAADALSAPTEQEKNEAAAKPKEEDFKSFQDWLSGLLK